MRSESEAHVIFPPIPIGVQWGQLGLIEEDTVTVGGHLYTRVDTLGRGSRRLELPNVFLNDINATIPERSLLLPLVASYNMEEHADKVAQVGFLFRAIRGQDSVDKAIKCLQPRDQGKAAEFIGETAEVMRDNMLQHVEGDGDTRVVSCSTSTRDRRIGPFKDPDAFVFTVRAAGLSCHKARTYRDVRPSLQESRKKESEVIVPGGVGNDNVVAFSMSCVPVSEDQPKPRRAVYVRRDLWDEMPPNERAAVVAPHIGRIAKQSIKYGPQYNIPLRYVRRALAPPGGLGNSRAGAAGSSDAGILSLPGEEQVSDQERLNIAIALSKSESEIFKQAQKQDSNRCAMM